MKLKKVMMVSYLEFASAPPLPTTHSVITSLPFKPKI